VPDNGTTTRLGAAGRPSLEAGVTFDPTAGLLVHGSAPDEL